MALVVLLRGVNVGGHRSFRPTALADALRRFDVVNIGAAGTLVVRQPGIRPVFHAALLRMLPAATQVACCEGRELLRLEAEDPFDGEPVTPGAVRFMSVLTRRTRRRPTLPIALPTTDEWLVRVTASRGRLVFGEYRRHMRTIGQLGRYRLITMRSNDQFNTTIYGNSDRLRGIEGTRDVLLINPDEMRRAGLTTGQIVSLVGDAGDGVHREVSGLTVTPFSIPNGCVGSYYPEMNPLIALSHHDVHSKTPASKAVPVRIRA